MVPCHRTDLHVSDTPTPIGPPPVVVGFEAETGMPYVVKLGDATRPRALPASELFPDGWVFLQAMPVQLAQATPGNGNLSQLLR
jgi:hypothetical protein